MTRMVEVPSHPDVETSATEFGRGMLVWFVTPKLLAGAGLSGA